MNEFLEKHKPEVLSFCSGICVGAVLIVILLSIIAVHLSIGKTAEKITPYAIAAPVIGIGLIAMLGDAFYKQTAVKFKVVWALAGMALALGTFEGAIFLH